MGNKERALRLMMAMAAVTLSAPLPQAAHAQVRGAATAVQLTDIQARIENRVGEDLRPFYSERNYRPLWLNEYGRPSGAASMLMHLLRTSEIDGVDPEKLNFNGLAKLVDDARLGDVDTVAEAEVQLSEAFAKYVRHMRAVDRESMIYESEALEPMVPTPLAALEAAAGADSLEDYVSELRWMHPLYAPLRKAAEDERYSEKQRHQIRTNLMRVRAIPAMPEGRHIVVDASSAQLWMYEDGKVVDSMKVVVGKPALPTPMMAGFIRYAIINPYWNVPDDLAATNIATNVLNRGVGYLKSGGYEVFESWAEGATKLDPAEVDWKAVHEGRTKIRVRQLPGGSNFMGKVKFLFPNEQGIYLHDTPDRDLLELDARQHSSGCVRLEDAPRLHRWLMGKPLPTGISAPEQFEALPEVVPVYITYLTARPKGDQQITFTSDPYGRDKTPFKASHEALAKVDRP